MQYPIPVQSYTLKDQQCKHPTLRYKNNSIQKLNTLNKIDQILKGQHVASWKNKIALDLCSVTPGYPIMAKSKTAHRQAATKYRVSSLETRNRNWKIQAPWKP